MVTMGQVAAQAGVSQATVSFVLGGNPDRLKISTQTRDRVLEVARELGYRRNMLARAMVTGKSRIIGVITSTHAGENIVQILAGAMEAANDHDYLLKVMHLPGDGVDDATITRCMEWRLAGAMVVGLMEDSQRWLHDAFHRAHLPLALIDNAPLPDWGVRFLSDDAHGIRQSASHLVSLGHRRIAFLGGAPSILSDWREISFRAAIADAGLSLPAHWVRNTSWTNQAVIEEGAQALLREDRPTAVVCSADAIAMVVLRVARSLGLRLPTDLSVTGYSNAELSAFADPPLTTVDQPFQEMGHAAVMHLIQHVESEEVDLSVGPRPEILLPTRLVERGSTAPPL
jgi:DNA-binding LacI/PurR family transcriptional regulator